MSNMVLFYPPSEIGSNLTRPLSVRPNVIRCDPGCPDAVLEVMENSANTICGAMELFNKVPHDLYRRFCYQPVRNVFC